MRLEFWKDDSFCSSPGCISRLLQPPTSTLPLHPLPRKVHLLLANQISPSSNYLMKCGKILKPFSNLETIFSNRQQITCRKLSGYQSYQTGPHCSRISNNSRLLFNIAGYHLFPWNYGTKHWIIKLDNRCTVVHSLSQYKRVKPIISR